jgi:hypothetical protein
MRGLGAAFSEAENFQEPKMSKVHPKPKVAAVQDQSLYRRSRRSRREADRVSGNVDSRLPVVDLARRPGLGDHARLRFALF